MISSKKNNTNIFSINRYVHNESGTVILGLTH